MDRKIRGPNVIHLAGIVPVAAPRLDFNCPWNDSLMPIAPNYLAVERAVYECAMAGCETIWIVAHIGTEPLLRKRVGDYITDPVSMISGLNPSLKGRDISIFYIPIHPRDRERRDCLAWSILYGADIAFRTSVFLSKWTLPTKYYCAFPYGIGPDKVFWKSRKYIGSTEKTIFTHKGKSVKDGLHMSFTFDGEDYKKARNIVRNRAINSWNHEKKENATEYKLEEVFSELQILPEETIELPWFYDISNWQDYVKYLSSEESKTIQKNTKSFTTLKRRVFATREEIKKMDSLNGINSIANADPPDHLESL